MDCAEVGALIRALRLEKGLTQRALAEKIGVGDKAVSKWERGMGCPDVTLLPALAACLGVRLESMLSGRLEAQKAIGGNMKRTGFYICPCCGNILAATGEAAVSCCGKQLERRAAKKAEPQERLNVEIIENEFFVSSGHPMTKAHYIAFVALLSGDSLILRKMYPEWNLETRLPRLGHGLLLWYCVQDGLFWQPI